jgi:peptidoglycan/LPS O-acetylase OafA/YrhL
MLRGRIARVAACNPKVNADHLRLRARADARLMVRNLNARKTDTIASIDGLRALAILAVIACHSIRPWEWSRIGARGVDLFFVVSGLCLSLAFFQRRAAGDISPFDYCAFAWARLRRILPPYYASLMLFAGLSFTAFAWPFIALHHFTPPTLAEYAQYFMFSYEDMFYPHANPVYWTLALEVRWYLLFPFILALYVRSKIAFAILSVVSYAAYSAGFPLLDMGTLPCFMLGIVASDIYVRGWLANVYIRRFLPLLTFCIFCIASLQQYSTPWWTPVDHIYPLFHIASFCIVVCALGPCSHLFSTGILRIVGRASYSIYLVHLPVILYLYSLKWTLPEVAFAGIFVGFAFYFAVESPMIAYFRRSKKGCITRTPSTSNRPRSCIESRPAQAVEPC